MSAKERFLKKLQDKQPAAYDNKAQADIAAFQQRMTQLHDTMENWLEGTGIRTASLPVTLVEFLIGGRTFSVPGIHLRYENKVVKFIPVFLYGQGVTGCVDASLCTEKGAQPLCRLFMRAGEHTDWTWRPVGIATTSGGAFDENAFFSLMEGVLE